jgi:hypothetical protein
MRHWSINVFGVAAMLDLSSGTLGVSEALRLGREIQAKGGSELLADFREATRVQLGSCAARRLAAVWRQLDGSLETAA